jgi:hypothetical protein
VRVPHERVVGVVSQQHRWIGVVEVEDRIERDQGECRARRQVDLVGRLAQA